ncbi:MAG: Trm112 family protein [Candidatus Aenigmarchaeota archaeon]|nr:Trm112 family protein [Candidatus Aenigmarchaeota archaeon]
MVSRKLLDILACPKCKKPIDYDKENNQLICHRCRLKFKVKDEIPDMLLEDAEAF